MSDAAPSAIDNAPDNADAPTAPKRAPLSRKAVIAVVAAMALALAGALYIALPPRAVSTDDAYLQADSSTIAPKINGLVEAVLVQHNQFVHRGDALVRIDPEDFNARVDSARATMQNAVAAVAAARAAIASLDAEEALAASNVRAAGTSVNAMQAQNAQAQSDRRRYDLLLDSGAAAKRDVEQFRTQALTARANEAHSRAELDVMRDQLAVTQAKRLTLQANLAQAQAAVASAQAALNLALQDQSHTVIRAPIDGVVGDRQVEQGDYVQPGSRLMTVVPLTSLYVIANFKETQTARMTAGQQAWVKVDALDGETLRGTVESFAPGSGSQFSLLPFEPGTGNFTKIVQRVPVRIRFNLDQPQLSRLRPGLSSTVTVELKTPARSSSSNAVAQR